MNFKLIFICLLVTGFWACSGEETAAKKETTKLDAPKTEAKEVAEAKLSSMKLEGEPDECRVESPHLPGEFLPFRITAECADEYTDKYEIYRTNVYNTLMSKGENPLYHSPKLIRGARVRLGELREILLDHQFGDDDQLFVMMGIIGDSTEMIFTLQSGTDKNTGSQTHYDFTQPCPTFCPWDY